MVSGLIICESEHHVQSPQILLILIVTARPRSLTTGITHRQSKEPWGISGATNVLAMNLESKGRKSSSFSSTHHPFSSRSQHASSSSFSSSSPSSVHSSPTSTPTVFGYLRNCISKLNHNKGPGGESDRDKGSSCQARGLAQRQPDRDSYSSSDPYDANSKANQPSHHNNSHNHHHHHHNHHHHHAPYQPFKEITRSYILPSPNRSVRDLCGYR